MKPKVIIHMYLSLDGKIETDLEGYPDSVKGGEIYDNITFEESKAWGCGRTTFEYLSNKNIDLSSFEAQNNPYVDNFIKDDIYCFSFDRKGKLFFDSPYNDYNNQKSRFVQVLTEQVDPRYISYLNSKGIAYIFAGKDDLDIDLFLAKLEKYGIDKFFLCGGGEINHAFLKADKVDEISLVIINGIQGGRRELTFVSGDDVSSFPKYFNIKEAKIMEGNTLYLRYVK